MKVSFPVALSAQIALAQRLDSIAGNVANSRTVGFRAEAIHFKSILSRVNTNPVAFSSPGEERISRRSGPISKTGNPLDVAVQGDAWLALKGPAGTIYTRDGRMRITSTGELQSLNGYPVLDVGGAPISLRPGGGRPLIARDGMITQKGKQAGAIGLFRIDTRAKLTRYNNSGVIPDREVDPVVDFTDAGIAQGFVEQSNVNAVMEISRLIEVMRSFDSISSMINETERSERDAIRTLGSGS